MIRTALVTEAINVSALLEEVSGAENGAASLFIGAVRNVNSDRAVESVSYSAYDEMALKELQSVAAECAARFGVANMAIEHRTGLLAVGEISIAIAAGHPHRAQAIGAVSLAIEEVKRRVPIWKLERYADGTEEWVNQASAHRPATVAAAAGPT